MSKITRVDIPAVDSAMDNLHTVAEEFAAVVNTLRRTAIELDGCWGSDKTGQKFAEGYLPNAEKLLENNDLTVTSLADIETNIRKIANMFATLDEDNGGVLELEDE